MDIVRNKPNHLLYGFSLIIFLHPGRNHGCAHKGQRFDNFNRSGDAERADPFAVGLNQAAESLFDVGILRCLFCSYRILIHEPLDNLLGSRVLSANPNSA
ncbi:hypothetical protein SDC9_103892 [bioreactor metagenome]|uniref:Uncharacterized protein n=1 Tax=bioreactor metagenome TaxID=1076179 RepID=A0A645B5R2_9ZZZZ